MTSDNDRQVLFQKYDDQWYVRFNAGLEVASDHQLTLYNASFHVARWISFLTQFQVSPSSMSKRVVTIPNSITSVSSLYELPAVDQQRTALPLFPCIAIPAAFLHPSVFSLYYFYFRFIKKRGVPWWGRCNIFLVKNQLATQYSPVKQLSSLVFSNIFFASRG